MNYKNQIDILINRRLKQSQIIRKFEKTQKQTNTQLAQCKKKLKQLEEAASTTKHNHNQAIASIQTKNLQLEKEVAKLKKELAKQSRNNRRLAKEVEAEKSKNTSLLSRIQELDQKIEEQEKEIKKRKRKNSSYLKSIGKWKKKATTSNKEIQRLKPYERKFRELKEKLQLSQNKVENLKQQIQKLHTNLSSTKKSFESKSELFLAATKRNIEFNNTNCELIRRLEKKGFKRLFNNKLKSAKSNFKTLSMIKNKQKYSQIAKSTSLIEAQELALEYIKKQPNIGDYENYISAVNKSFSKKPISFILQSLICKAELEHKNHQHTAELNTLGLATSFLGKNEAKLTKKTDKIFYLEIAESLTSLATTNRDSKPINLATKCIEKFTDFDFANQELKERKERLIEVHKNFKALNYKPGLYIAKDLLAFN